LSKNLKTVFLESSDNTLERILKGQNEEALEVGREHRDEMVNYQCSHPDDHDYECENSECECICVSCGNVVDVFPDTYMTKFVSYYDLEDDTMYGPLSSACKGIENFDHYFRFDIGTDIACNHAVIIRNLEKTKSVVRLH